MGFLSGENRLSPVPATSFVNAARKHLTFGPNQSKGSRAMSGEERPWNRNKPRKHYFWAAEFSASLGCPDERGCGIRAHCLFDKRLIILTLNEECQDHSFIAPRSDHLFPEHKLYSRTQQVICVYGVTWETTTKIRVTVEDTLLLLLLLSAPRTGPQTEDSRPRSQPHYPLVVLPDYGSSYRAELGAAGAAQHICQLQV